VTFPGMGIPLLVVPPQVDPSQPLYALPALAAYARRAGIPVAIEDLNVLVYHRMMSHDWLERCLARLPAAEARVRRDHPDLLPRFERDRSAAEVYGPRLLGVATWARDALRDPERFYDFDQYTRAMRIFDRALDLVSCAWFPTVLGYQSFEMGSHVRDLAGALRAARDPAENPFLELFAEEIVPRIVERRPPILGFSLMSPTQFIPALTIADLVKRRLPETITVIGGMPIVHSADRIESFGMLASAVDGFAVGDGEETLVELARAVEGGGDLARVPNFVSVRGGRVIRGPLRNVPMRGLPTPDFDGFPLDMYFSPELNLPVLASKGCAWGRCRFCTNSDPDASYRARPMRFVVEDIARLQAKYRTDVFSLIDDSISARQAEQFVDGLLERGLKIRWRFRTRAETGYTEDLARRLASAGCRKVYVGVESGSQPVLARMHKGTRLEVVDRVLGDFGKAGIPVHAFCMVGFPQETLEDVAATADLIVRRKDAIESILFGDFVLRRRSAAAREPALIGISSVRIDGDGIVDQVGFEVASGIGPGESKHVARKLAEEVASRAIADDGDDRRYDPRYARLQYLGNRYYSALDAPNFMYHCRYGPRRAQPIAGLARERVRVAISSSDFEVARLVFAPGVIRRCPDGRAYFYNDVTAHVIILSRDATQLATLCDGTRSVGEAVARFLADRKSPENAGDCRQWLEQMTLSGDLVLTRGAP